MICFAGRRLTVLATDPWQEQSESGPRPRFWTHYTLLLCYFAFQLSKNNKKGPLFRAGLFRILIVPGLYPPPPRPGLVIVMVLSTCPLAHTNMPHGLACRSHRVSGLGNLSISESLELNSGADGWILTSDFLLTGQAP